MGEGDFPKTDGDILYASEINYLNAGKIQQIYSGTGLNTSGGSDSASYEMDAVSDVKGSSYVIIRVIGEAFAEETNGNLRNIDLKIETKDIGGSYSDSLVDTTICGAKGATPHTVATGVGLSWIHTLTANEKTNGFQTKLTVTNGAIASGGYTGRQVVVELA